MGNDLEELQSLMENIINDGAVPRNIKASVSNAKEKISGNKVTEVELSSALYLLDETLSDINMPFHTRTELMGIISELERLKEKMK